MAKCACGQPAEPGSVYCKSCREAKIKEIDERLEEYMERWAKDDEDNGKKDE